MFQIESLNKFDYGTFPNISNINFKAMEFSMGVLTDKEIAKQKERQDKGLHNVGIIYKLDFESSDNATKLIPVWQDGEDVYKAQKFIRSLGDDVPAPISNSDNGSKKVSKKTYSKPKPSQPLEKTAEIYLLKMLEHKDCLIDYFSLEKYVQVETYVTAKASQVYKFILERAIKVNRNGFVFLQPKNFLEGFSEGYEVYTKPIHISNKGLANAIKKLEDAKLIKVHKFNETDKESLYILNIKKCRQLYKLIKDKNVNKIDCQHLLKITREKKKSFSELNFSDDLSYRFSKNKLHSTMYKLPTNAKLLHSTMYKLPVSVYKLHIKTTLKLSDIKGFSLSFPKINQRKTEEKPTTNQKGKNLKQKEASEKQDKNVVVDFSKSLSNEENKNNISENKDLNSNQSSTPNDNDLPQKQDQLSTEGRTDVRNKGRENIPGGAAADCGQDVDNKKHENKSFEPKTQEQSTKNIVDSENKKLLTLLADVTYQGKNIEFSKKVAENLIKKEYIGNTPVGEVIRNQIKMFQFQDIDTSKYKPSTVLYNCINENREAPRKFEIQAKKEILSEDSKTWSPILKAIGENVNEVSEKDGRFILTAKIGDMYKRAKDYGRYNDLANAIKNIITISGKSLGELASFNDDKLETIAFMVKEVMEYGDMDFDLELLYKIYPNLEIE